MKIYDLIVIGTGAGNTVLDVALQKGLKCAVIEKGKFGGTCLTRGCSPTKVLATLADEIITLKKAHKLGIKIDDYSIDWNKVTKNVWSKINESEDLILYFNKYKNLDIYQGIASFQDAQTIKVTLNTNDEVEIIKGNKIVINTGGITKIPKIEGLDDVGFLTSESFFGDAWPKSPYKSLTIIGGGPIGVEFAHIFEALGSRINLIQHNKRLLPKEDEEISQEILKHLNSRNINVFLNKETLSIYQDSNEKVLKIKDITTNEITEVRSEEVLIASGISPCIHELQVKNIPLELDKRGYILTNEFLETSMKNIYALGDINGQPAFRHKANMEADVLAHNLYEAKNPNEFRFAEYDLIPSVTYCSPQVAHIGLTEAEAITKGYEIKTGHHHYYQTVKGYALGLREDDELKNFAKIIVNKNDNSILGLHIIGPDASVLIQPVVNLLNIGDHKLHEINPSILSSPESKIARENQIVRTLNPKNLNTLLETMAPHPALSELVAWIAWYMD